MVDEPKRDASPATGAPAPAASTKLSDQRLYPTAHANEAQLETIKDALDQPPQRPSLVAMLTSVAGGLLVAAKALKDMLDAGKPGGIQLAFFALGVAVAAVAAITYVAGVLRVYPHHQRAKQYVARLIAAQGGKPLPELQKPGWQEATGVQFLYLAGVVGLFVWRPEIAWPVVALILIGNITNAISKRQRPGLPSPRGPGGLELTSGRPRRDRDPNALPGTSPAPAPEAERAEGVVPQGEDHDEIEKR